MGRNLQVSSYSPWIITEREEKRIHAFDKAHRRLLCITYRQYKTNKYVREIILNQIGNMNLSL